MDIVVHTHLSPRVVEVLSPTASVTLQEIVNAVRDWEDDNLSFDQLIAAAGKEALGGGISVGITATLLNAQLMFSGRAIPLEYGKTCTTEDLTGKVLKCSTGLFLTNGVYRGCTVANFTTTGLASVISVDSETQLTSFQLSGGTRETWLVGDDLRVYENTQCSITGGNLVAVDASGAEISPVMQSPHVQVVRSSSSSSTLQELSAIQYSSFGGGVTVDVINGVAGTAYNIGTVENPSNNLTDAVAIANGRGFHTLFINESMTLDAGTDIQNFNIIGRSMSNTCIVVDSSAICDHIGLQNCNISGVLDGGTRVNNCLIGAIDYVSGHILNSFLYGTLVLSGNEDAVFANCGVSDPNNIPVIDMGGSGQNAIITDYSGGIKFRNLTGANKIAIQIDGGRVFLESTISAGFVGITGVGELFDSSTGTANISTSGLMSKATITEAIADEIGSEIQVASFNKCITIDVLNGVAGTDYSVGTSFNPVNNIADAKTIAIARGFKKIHVHGDLTLASGDDVIGYIFEAHGHYTTTITISASSLTSNCEFVGCEITGTLGGNNKLTDCWVVDVYYVNGEVINCRLTGTIYLDGGADTVFISCGTAVVGSPVIIDMGGSGQNCMFHDWSGGITIKNMNGVSNMFRGQFDGGKLIIDSTVSAGMVVVVGIGLLADNSTGTATVNIDGLVNKETVADAVWERDLSIYSSGAAATIQALIFGKEVVMDSVTGVSGTDFPTGTRERPVNNLADALTICSIRGLVRIMTRTGFTVQAGQSIEGIVIATHGIMGTNIIFEAGCSVDKATIRYANISGEITIGDTLFVESCSIGALENFTGIMNLATLGEGSEVSIGTWANLINCHCGGEPTNEPEISIGTGALTIIGYSGNVKLTNKIGTNRTVANFLSGNVSIASTCIAGKIQILGIGEVENDNSGAGCQVDVDAALTNKFISDHVWDEPKIEHIASGSTGEALVNMHDEAMGTWKLDPAAKTLTYYKADDTVLKVFNLTSTGDAVPAFIERLA